MAHGKSYFTTFDDICDATKTKQCTNGFNAVKKLQMALNEDKNIRVKLKVDGKWGEETKEAVVKFQKYYRLSHRDGRVGKESKKKLDQLSSGIKFPKVKNNRQVTLMKYDSYRDFRKNTNVKKSYSIFEDKKLLNRASSGIGLHASKYVKRYPGSNGCIRLPHKVSSTIFKKVTKGTIVSIVS